MHITMKEATIEELAYSMKRAKAAGKPAPIFFLGAGASKSGDIPLAHEIVKDILKQNADNPRITRLPKEERTYAKLMDCLDPHDRNTLLKGYIDMAKINVTHIYLAQLMTQGFADYILTVNFDNLMLRALALFNEFPSTYDMAILKDLTTTTFKEKSVVYLHGQHHGLWLLNTDEEMAKVKTLIPQILNRITNERPWVFIGYSGEDPIFEHIINLGRFDNGLYWVGFNDENPCGRVCKDLLGAQNKNAKIIRGYDADTFMLKLSIELVPQQPDIFSSPFSALKMVLGNIVDINDEEHFQPVKQRLQTSNRQVEEAIRKYEHGEMPDQEANKHQMEIDRLNKEIANQSLSGQFDEAISKSLAERATELNDKDAIRNVAWLYFDEANRLCEEAKSSNGAKADHLFAMAFNKYCEAKDIKPDMHEVYNNWGSYLSYLAKTKQGVEADRLYASALEKFHQAIEIRPDKPQAFNNWGNVLGEMAKTKQGEEADRLYAEAFDKYRRAIDIKPDMNEAFNNWGTYLGNQAKTKQCEEADSLYAEAFDKYLKATVIKPDSHEAFNNWGTYLGNQATTKNGDEADRLYVDAFNKFWKATHIKSDFQEAFNNWGNVLGNLAKTKKGEEADRLYAGAFDKFSKATEIKRDMHEAFNNWGNVLGNLAKAKLGEEADRLYADAFDKFRKATEIKPDKHEAFYNWGSALLDFAKTKQGDEAVIVYAEAKQVLLKGIESGGSSYNLACLHALLNEKDQALKLLKHSLYNKEITAQFVQEDEDWNNLKEDPDFKALLASY